MRKFLAILVVVLILSGAGYYYYIKHTKSTGVTTQARHAATMPAIPVKVATVETHSMPLKVSALGEMVAPRTIMLTARQPGSLVAVYFKSGDWVKKGQLLAKIDDALQLADLRSAQADYLAKMKMYRRYMRAPKGSVPKNDITTVVGQYQAAKALVESKKKVLINTRVVAPFSGHVGVMQTVATTVGKDVVYTKVNKGAYLQVGTPIATLTNPHRIEVQYQLPQSYSGAIKPGQRVLVSSSAYPGVTFKGKVTYISSLVSEVSQTFRVMALIDNPKARLKSGMNVFVTQVLNPHRRVLAVPGLALVPSIDGYSVYVVKKNRVKAITVKIGVRDKAMVEIVSGLKAGQTYIIDGIQKVHPGTQVKVVSK